jgi:hypothetical protein
MECLYCKKVSNINVTLTCYDSNPDDKYEENFCNDDCCGKHLRETTVEDITDILNGIRKCLEFYKEKIKSDHEDTKLVWFYPMWNRTWALYFFNLGLLKRKSRATLLKFLDILKQTTQEAFDIFDGDKELREANPVILYDLGKWLSPVVMKHYRTSIDAWATTDCETETI